jgi:hypothetical protein
MYVSFLSFLFFPPADFLTLTRLPGTQQPPSQKLSDPSAPNPESVSCPSELAKPIPSSASHQAKMSGCDNCPVEEVILERVNGPGAGNGLLCRFVTARLEMSCCVYCLFGKVNNRSRRIGSRNINWASRLKKKGFVQYCICISTYQFDTCV